MDPATVTLLTTIFGLVEKYGPQLVLGIVAAVHKGTPAEADWQALATLANSHSFDDFQKGRVGG